ncbi:MAG: hypothetical protein V1802_00620 [Candidatus Aenigmatarchaeota archaeon]
MVATTAFLAISVMFRGYHSVSGTTEKYREDFYFYEIKEQMNKVVSLSDCSTLANNLDEFIYFTKQKMTSMGYFFYANYSSGCNPTFGILIASEKYRLYENVNPDDVIK